MIAIVDYGVGNIHSVRNALETIGAEVVVAGRPEDLCNADRIVLPGVGAFGTCIYNLRRSGMLESLEEQVVQRGKPLYGICVGMQVLAEEGHEMGVHPGLGWLEGKVVKLRSEELNLKLPHVGWNNVEVNPRIPLFKGFSAHPTFYFVHSYHLTDHQPEHTAATCDYGQEFTAAAIKGNIFATQFHPEKSQQNGLRLLENFVNWNP
jgi:glutamine amidotransferase